MNSPVEEIKSRLNIVDVIQGYIRLQKAGVNYKAACPFHGEKTPSFFVSPTRQIWHCFGCGKGGDLFKFVMEIEGHDFPEALRLLANRAGVAITREDPKLRSERNRLYDICEETAKLFEHTLSLTPSVLKYVSSRGVKPETVKSFRIGYAPKSWDFLQKALAEKGFRAEELEKAGLLVRSEERGSYYDRFRGRIMFPIFDQSSRVIGFGGRIFEEVPTRTAVRTPASPSAPSGDAGAKYINTPQTLIYDKSRVLYGFDKAKQDIRVQGAAVLVEGYMDCVMSYQAGVKHTIAVSGTALTPQQIGVLKRLTDTLLFSFDTDAAGESATKRSLSLAAEVDFERKIIEIPSGKDPADAVAENPAEWVSAVSRAEPVVNFYYKKAFVRFDPRTPEGKKEISALVLPFIAELSDEIQKAHWVEKLSDDLGVPRESVQTELLRRSRILSEDSRAAPRGPAASPAPAPVRRRDLLEERFLALLAVIEYALRDSIGDSPHIAFGSSVHSELFAILRNGVPESVPVHLTDQYSMLRFKGEILKEMTELPIEELAVSCRELEKECVRDRLLAIGEEIERLEKSGEGASAAPLLNDFRTLSLHLKSLS